MEEDDDDDDLMNGTIFVGKKGIEHKTRVFIYSATSVWNISHSTKNSAIHYLTCTVHVPSCSAPIILVRLQSDLHFLGSFSKNIQISNFIKIRPMRIELFYADRQAGMTKLTFASLNIANAPNNGGW